MSGFENYWNFKTMLDQGDCEIDDVESKSDYDLRISVPFLSSTRSSGPEIYQAEEEAFQPAEASVACETNNFEELHRLEQLTIGELHELRRKVALQNHPDSKFKIGFGGNYDLMSVANGLIDDEIKRRS